LPIFVNVYHFFLKSYQRQVQTKASSFAPLESDGFDGDAQMNKQSEDRLRGFHHYISTQNQASFFGCYK